MAQSTNADDIARAVFGASEQTSASAPSDQSTWLIAEVRRLVGEQTIDGLADIEIDDVEPGFILAIIGGLGYLLRWTGENLEVTYLNRLQGLRYRELTRGRGAMRGFEGEPELRIWLSHPALPGDATITLVDWQVGENAQLRVVLREWANAPTGP